MRKLLLLGICTLSAISLQAQHSLTPLNEDLYNQIDRLVIKQGGGQYGFQGTAKPYSRYQVSQLLRNSTPESRVDKFQWEFLAKEHWTGMDSLNLVDRRPLAKYFFRTKTDLYSVNTDGLTLRLNPVIQLSGGLSPGDDAQPFRNTRGVEVHGTIDNKVSFYTIMADNQATWAPYVRRAIDSVNVVPGQGFWKPFRENGVDFFLARGHVSVPITKHIEVHAGHDRQFIGHGYRSMIWSDFAPPALFLRADTRIWKVRYTNLFTQGVANIYTTPQGTLGTRPFTHKQIVLHHLSVNLAPNFQGGVFELVVNGDADSLGSGFGINYLNPIIFYRALEQQGGSSGNVLLGADFKWDLLNSLRLYGQFVLDEFLLSEIRARNGWWGNKYGAQLGFKYVDALNLSGLDLQAEVNWARPYTYTHLSHYTSVTHYQQPLAHPLGANFKEVVGIVRWQGHPRWQVSLKGIGAVYGADSAGTNWGTNLLLPYDTRQQQYNNVIGQGAATQLLLAESRISYQLWHQCFLEGRAVFRQRRVQNQETQRESYFEASLRWSLPYRPQDF